MNYSDFYTNRVRYNINITNKAKSKIVLFRKNVFIKLIINNVILICLVDSSIIYSLFIGI